MGRLTTDQWQTVRAKYEAGATLSAVARDAGVSHTAVMKRAKAEGWTQNAEAAIQQKVAAKVSGLVATRNPEKLAAAIDAEAERRAAVIKRHREEVNLGRERLYAGIRAAKDAKEKNDKDNAFADLKAAKISLEAMTLLHQLEAKAWGIAPLAATRQGDASNGELHIQVVYG